MSIVIPFMMEICLELKYLDISNTNSRSLTAASIQTLILSKHSLLNTLKIANNYFGDVDISVILYGVL